MNKVDLVEEIINQTKPTKKASRKAIDVGLKRTKKLIIVFLPLTLVIAITTVAAAYQDYVFTYKDAGHTQPATSFGDGDTVYVKVTDNYTTGGTKIISVTNDQLGNSISVSVSDGDLDTIYGGSFVIHSGADEAGKLHIENGQTATISADLDGDGNGAAKQITADYEIIITPLVDMVWIYSDSSYTEETTEFGNGSIVYLKATDTETKAGTKEIIVKNDQIENTISINLTDSNGDSFYFGSFIVYSGANDDANDMLTLFDGQTATITVDLAEDGTAATKQITANYDLPTAILILPPSTLTAMATDSNIKLTWTAPSETYLNQYNIYRGSYSGGEDFSTPMEIVAASGQSSYEWIDYNVAQGITYYYVVRSQNILGNESENSSEASATITAQLLSLGFQRPFIVRSSGSSKVILKAKQAVNVNIRILNINSIIVHEWNSYFSSGEEKEWTWNGVNMYGEEVNNGVYIWEMKAITANGESQKEVKIVGVLR